jgi:NitT/TauT family transport system permease protein
MSKTTTNSHKSDLKRIWIPRVILIVVLLSVWEFFGRFVDATWTSQPSLIIVRLAQLARHTAVTLTEIVVGLCIGVPSGVVIGMWLGRSTLTAILLRPIIVGLNAVPVVALSPLLIMWFGLGMMPKIALVTLVSFLLLFFNTFAGAQAVDRDWIAALQIMGATRREQFQKAVAPACMPWIMSGLKNALPYSLIAATIGEIMLAREGLGYLITDSASQFDMTGIYTSLFVMMMLGAVINEVAARLETWLLRWRMSAT